MQRKTKLKAPLKQHWLVKHSTGICEINEGDYLSTCQQMEIIRFGVLRDVWYRERRSCMELSIYCSSLLSWNQSKLYNYKNGWYITLLHQL